MLPNEKPCNDCIHKRVCEASKKFDEINVSVTHPFFKARIECVEFQHKPEAFIKKADGIYSADKMHKAVIEEGKNEV